MPNTNDLKRDLNGLVDAEPFSAGLDPPAARPDIAAGIGVGYADDVNQTGGGGGIAWPLDEQQDTRTYYDTRYLYSTDGIFAIAFSPIKQAVFNDADGIRGEVNFLDPDA